MLVKPYLRSARLPQAGFSFIMDVIAAGEKRPCEALLSIWQRLPNSANWRFGQRTSFEKRYADVAECYRLLANERQRLIAAGAMDQP